MTIQNAAGRLAVFLNVMKEPGIYWVRRRGSEAWSVAELRHDRWVMFGVTETVKDADFVEIGDLITLPPKIESRRSVAEGTRNAQNALERAQ